MAETEARGHRINQSSRARRSIRNSIQTVSILESLEQRQLLAAITVVVTDPLFAPPGGSRAIPNDGQDDAPAIQRAIDYVPQAGNVLLQPNGSNYTVQAGDTVGTVYFPTGVYDFISPPVGGTQGPNLRLKPGINASSVRTYQGAPGAILRRPSGTGTFLDHNSPLLQGTGADAHDILIKGLTFEGAGIKLEQSISGVWCDNVDITGCVFQNVNDGDGLSYMIGVSSGARNCDIVGNTFQNLNSFAAILALNVENFHILHNTLDTVHLGIQIGGPTRLAAPGLEISDNRITRTIEEGIQIIPGGTDTATGNQNYYDGIYVRRNIVSDFRTVDGTYYDGASFALEVIGNYSTNVIIENNKVFGKLMAAPPDKSQYRLLPVYGIEVSGDGAIVRNNLVEGFWVPIAGNAYHNPQADAVIYVQNNRLRGQWWSELTSGVEVRSGTFNITNDDTTRAVERAVIVGGDLIVAENSVNSTDDTINIGGSDGAVTVSVNGTTATGSPFAPAGGILVYGRDGNDSVTVASSLTRTTSLIGGNGNDTLTAGSGASTIYGDAGDDSLVGGAAVDSVFGGFGNDTLAGSDADLLDGGPGSNTIIRNGAPPPAADSFLSDLAPTSATNGWGPFEKDHSNGEAAAGDGKTITLNGSTYAKGLGVHANSDLRYSLGGQFKTFTADIGVDDEVGNSGNVTFQVWADGVKLYDSGVMTGATATKQVSVDITGKSQLQLVVLNNGDASFDHADWANAKIWVSSVTPPPPPSGDTFLSDLAAASTTNGWGPIELNRSNGEQAAGDGKVITLNGTTYASGLGVHAASTVIYNLNGQYAQFLSDVGIDDEAGSNGSVNFQVYLDNVLVYDSGRMTGTSATTSITLDVSGKNQLKLVVTDSGDGNAFDHADWANARLVKSATPPPVGTAFVSDLTPTSATNGWGPYEKDRSNGESAAGDGKTITLNGATYAKGLGVHANSTLAYDLTGKGYTTFTSDIGVDDEVGTRGSVIFQVWADGTKLYDSGLMTGSTVTKSISVPVSGKNTFSLVVINGNDGFDYDHADWAGAKLS